jgi:N12 class adenine-specific DNA methylase
VSPLAVPPSSFRPRSQHDLAPSGAGAKVAANVAALQLLRRLQDEDRPAAPDEQAVLARWSGWGSVPKVFDDADEKFADARAELRSLLDEREWRAASKTTLNAHYTDAALAQAMWDVLAKNGLGIEGRPLRMLEPGCGAGTFLGLAPDQTREKDAAVFGVELDPTTAAIAAHLYPHAQIRQESFADTRFPRDYFDLVIGNVPFGNITLHDKTHNAGGHSLHNHFIIKSLALTRPGGVVAVLTSHYTMDSANPAARREIAAMADLIAAVRLPSSAHQKAAGTQVITDVLVLRRRDPADGPGDASEWDSTVRIGGDEQREVLANRYFAEHHPDRVIGQVGTRSGQFGPELAVTLGRDHDGNPEADVAGVLYGQLSTAVDEHPSPAGGLFAAPLPAKREHTRPAPITHPDAPIDAQQGHLSANGSGGFTVVDAGALTEHKVPKSQAKELTALLGLRDTTMELLAAEAGDAEDTDRLSALRARLNTRYDAYLKQWGPINRISWRRTGRVDEITGEDRLARINPPQGGFRSDPQAPAVYALEDFDATTGTARKAPITSGRVIAPRAPRLGADTPADAVAICLDAHGEVRLAEVARLLGRSEDDTRQSLAGIVFTDPGNPADGALQDAALHDALALAGMSAADEVTPSGSAAQENAERLIPAAEYLSGNVRAKLAAAEAAADRDAATEAGGRRWDANIAALREVLPTDLTPVEIDARLGASWIGAEDVEQFLREVLDEPTIQVEHPGGSTWAVRGGRHSVLATSTYGTSRASAGELVAALLEQRQISIYDHFPDGTRIPNLTETVAAQEKADEITERFRDWVWEDPDRAERLARRYNDMFNSIVLRSYDGASMQLPGLTVTFKPRAHQLAAIARIVAEPAVLLAHEVGAGKTAEMVCGAMELRRLGLARKPCVVVPNHMLEQFSREWMQLYPQARILAASVEDLAREKRRMLIAKIATGDWDAVIVSRSAFERIPLSIPAQQAYLDSQLEDMRRQLETAKGGRGLTVKRLENSLARAEERLKKLTDSAKDPGISFEQTGIDYVFADEAHGYKNLRTVSNIDGVAVEGSQRASDMDMKLGWLRERHGGRVATFATATPIANSVAEAYTMQRFLRPDLLDDAGLTDFDTWAATFGEVTSDLELAPDGSRFRMKARFAKFRNVPELLRIWHVSADIKTAEDLNLPTPDLRGGHAETVVVPANDQLREFMRELAERADKVHGRRAEKGEDNMLRVATHGRMAALDLRLLGRDPGEDSKLTAAANRIAAIHHANAERRYDDPATNSDLPGSLQIVFSDLGTPNPHYGGTGLAGEWNVYDQLKDMLIDRGVPAERIRFVHDARNDKQKAELFAACRNGRISVLIGSTEKMGVGTNVQARAVALHHLDCPWRPADIAQREGRILRQGNLNPEVEVIRHVAEGSFDAFLWQTVTRKAKFIAQVMRGRLDVREIEDIGETALSYDQVKALATGDPRIMEKAKVDAELTRLERLERNHARNQRNLSATIDKAEKSISEREQAVAQIDQAIQQRIDTTADRFAMTIGSTRWTARADAAIALRNALAAIGGTSPDTTQYTAWDRPHHIGSIGGFDITATPRRFLEPHLSLELAGIPRSHIRVDYDELRADRPLGIVMQLENRIRDLERTRHKIQTEADALRREADQARADYGKPFTRREALEVARARSTQLATELAEKDKRREHTPSSGTSADTSAAASPARTTTIITTTSARTPSTAESPSAAEQATDGVLAKPEPPGRDGAAQPPHTPDEHVQMAKDTAAASFADRTPITAMDRPSVERELRHVHDDKTHYSTAHAAAADSPTEPDDPDPLPDVDPANETDAQPAAAPQPGGTRTNTSDAARLDEIRRPEDPAEITWTPSAPAFGGYYEHATVNGRRVQLRQTANLNWAAMVDGQKVRGSWRDLDTAKTMIVRIVRELKHLPVDRPAQARPAAAASQPSQSRIRVEHTNSGTLVHGTQRGDAEVRAALKQQGFRWSRRLEAWYLPRNYRYETRSARVAALQRTLGDTISIDTGDATTPDPSEPPAAADQSPATPEHNEPSDTLTAEREEWRNRVHPRGKGPYAVWDMKDGRFAAIRRSDDGMPQGSVVGGAYRTRTQANAYVDALNAGGTHDQAQLAVLRADPAGARRGGQLLDNPPAGRWTDADRVTSPSAPDTRRYPSAQQYPIGTPLTVHAVTADGTAGRRLGHGVVTDHPGPDHVVVESPWGTRRVAHLNHVSQPHQPAATPPTQPPAAEDRWASTCAAIDPAIVADPHWPALARSLDRIEAAGHDVDALLREVTTRRALPAGNPARSLDYRLADAAPDASGLTSSQTWTTDPAPPPTGPAGPISAPQIGRGGSAR